MGKVFCKDCLYYQEWIVNGPAGGHVDRCIAPENIDNVKFTNYYDSRVIGKFKKCPDEINMNGNCPWFLKSTFWKKRKIDWKYRGGNAYQTEI